MSSGPEPIRETAVGVLAVADREDDRVALVSLDAFEVLDVDPSTSVNNNVTVPVGCATIKRLSHGPKLREQRGLHRFEPRSANEHGRAGGDGLPVQSIKTWHSQTGAAAACGQALGAWSAASRSRVRRASGMIPCARRERVLPAR